MKWYLQLINSNCKTNYKTVTIVRPRTIAVTALPRAWSRYSPLECQGAPFARCGGGASAVVCLLLRGAFLGRSASETAAAGRPGPGVRARNSPGLPPSAADILALGPAKFGGRPSGPRHSSRDSTPPGRRIFWPGSCSRGPNCTRYDTWYLFKDSSCQLPLGPLARHRFLPTQEVGEAWTWTTPSSPSNETVDLARRTLSGEQVARWAAQPLPPSSQQDLAVGLQLTDGAVRAGCERLRC
jgi:hypothetical protein